MGNVIEARHRFRKVGCIELTEANVIEQIIGGNGFADLAKLFGIPQSQPANIPGVSKKGRRNESHGPPTILGKSDI